MSDVKHHREADKRQKDHEQPPQPTPGPAPAPADPTSVPPVDPDPPEDQ